MVTLDPLEIEAEIIAALQSAQPTLPVFPLPTVEVSKIMLPGEGYAAYVIYLSNDYLDLGPGSQNDIATVRVLVGSESLRATSDGRHRSCLYWLPKVRDAIAGTVTEVSGKCPIAWRVQRMGFQIESRNGAFFYGIDFAGKDIYTG